MLFLLSFNLSVPTSFCNIFVSSQLNVIFQQLLWSSTKLFSLSILDSQHFHSCYCLSIHIFFLNYVVQHWYYIPKQPLSAWIPHVAYILYAFWLCPVFLSDHLICTFLNSFVQHNNDIKTKFSQHQQLLATPSDKSSTVQLHYMYWGCTAHSLILWPFYKIILSLLTVPTSPVHKVAAGDVLSTRAARAQKSVSLFLNLST